MKRIAFKAIIPDPILRKVHHRAIIFPFPEEIVEHPEAYNSVPNGLMLVEELERKQRKKWTMVRPKIHFEPRKYVLKEETASVHIVWLSREDVEKLMMKEPNTYEKMWLDKIFGDWKHKKD